MSGKTRLLRRFGRLVRGPLKAQGFTGTPGHYVRREGAVTQVIELQHSIYGGRVTANLGVDLEWLGPMIRWIPCPKIGPHAHDAVRWVRLGLVLPEGKDRWWNYDEATPQSLKAAAEGLSQAILGDGLAWFDRAKQAEAFESHAQERLKRSMTPNAPDGGYAELRLMAAIAAWQGDYPKARELAQKAAPLWKREADKLRHSRAMYKDQLLRKRAKLPRVPNLQSELMLIISPTMAERAFSAELAAFGPRPRLRRSLKGAR